MRFAQKASLPIPLGATTPSPVTTTRRREFFILKVHPKRRKNPAFTLAGVSYERQKIYVGRLIE